MMSSLGFRVLALFGFLVCVSSLYEDQAGVNDFHLENIGKVKNVIFHSDSSKRRLFASTEANMIAALDSKSGAILWRHQLSAEESVDKIEYHGRFLAAATGGGSIVRVFSAGEGTVLWDEPFGTMFNAHTSSEIEMSFVSDMDHDGIDELAVGVGNEVRVFGGDAGKSMWHWQSEEKTLVARSIVETSDEIVSVVLTNAPGSSGKHGIQIVQLNAKTGGAKSSTTSALAKPSGASSKFCAESTMTAKGVFVCLDKSAQMLHTWGVKSRQGTSHSISSLAGGADVDAKQLSLSESTGSTAVILQISKTAALALAVSGSDGSDVKTVHTFKGKGALSAGMDKEGGETVAQVRTKGSGKGVEVISVQIPSGKSNTQAFDVCDQDICGTVEATFVNPFIKKDESKGLRVLFSSDSYTLTMLQQDKMIWQREEALAYVTQAGMIDLPVPAPAHNELLDEVHIAEMNPLDRLVRRTVADLQDIISMVAHPEEVVSNHGKKVAWDKTGLSKEHDIIGDRFGFKKIIVVMTAPGMVIGIHSRSGLIVWKKYLGAHKGKLSEVKPQKFFITRGSSAEGNVEMLILGSLVESSQSFVALINPLNGAEISYKALPYQIEQASMLPLINSEHTHLIMVIDTQQKVHVFPDTEESSRAVAKNSQKIFFYLTNPEKTQLTGYSIHSVSGGLQAEQAWNIAFPGGETMVTLAAHDANEPIKSAGRVLGNRAVLLKYINANLLALGTYTPAGGTGSNNVKTAPTMKSKEPVVRIYLVDTVAGAIVHNVVHKDAEGPVHMVQTENVLVYSFWNNKKDRNELSVLELYENTKHEITTAMDMRMFQSNTSSFSSMQLEKPRVLSQSYILPVGVKGMSVTQTMHGITTKNILVALTNDKVLSIDKKFLDPRRPMGKPTPEDQEEMLVPYQPYLPLVSTAILSYTHTIFGLRGIAVAPAQIESTSMMVAYGTDIFYCRVTPAKAYDCLGEDFNYPALILAVVGLGALSWAVVWFQGRRELSEAWK